MKERVKSYTVEMLGKRKNMSKPRVINYICQHRLSGREHIPSAAGHIQLILLQVVRKMNL